MSSARRRRGSEGDGAGSTITLLSVAVGWLSFRFGPIRLITEDDGAISIIPKR